MNDSRERFMDWHIDHVGRLPRLCTPKGLFEDDKKAWAAWQAAERQALERAAKRFEGMRSLETRDILLAMIEQSASKEKQHG